MCEEELGEMWKSVFGGVGEGVRRWGERCGEGVEKGGGEGICVGSVEKCRERREKIT